MSNTPLTRVPVDEMPDSIASVWKTLDGLTGDASFVEVFAAAPELLDFVMQAFYTNIFFSGRVGQRYKQLARLKLSLVHGCRTCNKQNVPGALAAGISEEEIAALDDFRNGPFSAADKAVLEYAELMSIGNLTRRLEPDLHARLSAHFSAAEICELGMVAAVISGLAKMSFVLDVVEQEDYCRFA